MSTLRLLLVVACLAPACSGDGQVEIHFTFAGGRPADLTGLWIHLRAEEQPTHRILSTITELYAPNKALHFTVPNGEQRVIIAELRDGEDFANSQVIYYGRSQTFSVGDGDRLRVELEIPLVHAPELAEPNAFFMIRVNNRASGSVGVRLGITARSIGVESLLLGQDPALSFNRQTVPAAAAAIACSDPGLECFELDYTIDLSACERGECPAGFINVFAKLVDRFGYESPARALQIVDDILPPAAVSEGLALVPALQSMITMIERAGLESTVRLNILMNEPIAETSSVATVAPAVLDFRLERADDRLYVFELKIDRADLPQGEYSIRLSATDFSGNHRSALLTSTFVVDTEPPRAPDAAKVVYQRAPLGTAASGGAPKFDVEGAPGAVEASAIMFAYDGSDTGVALRLGSAIAAADGSFSLDLDAADRARVYLTSVDRAGNASDAETGMTGAQAHLVERGRWTASLIGKIPGTLEPNPHRLTATRLMLPQLEHPAELAAEGSAAELAALAAIDGSSLTRTAIDGRWSHQQKLAERPPAPVGPAGAFDPARGVVVVFTDRGETWEWDGRQWSNATPPAPSVSPPARSGHALAYDGVRGRMLLFGGTSLNQRIGDLWEWDGSTWTELHPLGERPGPRFAHAMAFDAGRGVIVVHGAAGVAGLDDAETWEWNGTEWRRNDRGAPGPGRRDHRMVYDPIRARIVLFGGTWRDSPLAETWEYDGTDWIQRSSSGPPARRYFGMTYDSVHERALVFGGDAGSGFSHLPLADLWSWDGNTWSELTSDRRPPPRYHGAFVFDPIRGEAILAGGFAHDFYEELDDVWIWDGVEWRERGPRVIAPAHRGTHALAFDAQRGRAVLFGGRGASGLPTGDLWEWTGGWWIERIAGGPAPDPRRFASMAYDQSRGVTVLFGGYGTTGGALAETWEWNGTSWRLASPPSAPPAQGQGAMVYSSSAQRVLWFGGSAMTNDLWAWDGASWTILGTAGPRPSARQDHAMAYDAARDRVVLFGGGSNLDDLWEWDGANWTQLTPAGARPDGRIGHAMSYDAQRGVIVMFGGSRSSTQLDDTWQWNGTTWSRWGTPGATVPPARWFTAMVFDGWRTFLAGGEPFTGAAGSKMDSWYFDGSTWSRPFEITAPGDAGAIAYDSARERAIVFDNTDTWEWDGVDWNARVGSVGPAGVSGEFGLAFDATTARVVLFGSASYGSTTWEWDGTSWVSFAAQPGGPPGRARPAITFDETRGRVLMFGGFYGGGTYDDLWEWNGNTKTWSELSAASRPPARMAAGLAWFDGEVIMFGGTDYANLYQDTWSWDGLAWTQRIAAPPSSVDYYWGTAMTYDRARGRLVRFSASSTPGDDVWEWDGSAWRQRVAFGGAQPSLLSTEQASMTFDTRSGRALMYKGSSIAPGSELWAWIADPDDRPAALLEIDVHSARLALSDIERIAAGARAGGRGYTSELGGAPAMISGAELLAWDGSLGKWSAIGANDASSPAELSGELRSARSIRASDEKLHLAVRPRAGRGSSLDAPEVALDYFEVAIDYRVAPR